MFSKTQTSSPLVSNAPRSSLRHSGPMLGHSRPRPARSRARYAVQNCPMDARASSLDHVERSTPVAAGALAGALAGELPVAPLDGVAAPGSATGSGTGGAA